MEEQLPCILNNYATDGPTNNKPTGGNEGLRIITLEATKLIPKNSAQSDHTGAIPENLRPNSCYNLPGPASFMGHPVDSTTQQK